MKERLLGRVCAAVLAAVIAGAGLLAQSAPTAESPRMYVTSAGSALVGQGLALAAPRDAELATFQKVPGPGVRNVQNEAIATSAAWIDSNAWRYQKGLRKANYATLAAGAAGLAAAEAFAFNVDAVINAPPPDVDELGNVLRFLKAHSRPPMPGMANIGVVDNGSPYLDEAINMLTRRNLLFRMVPASDRGVDVTVEIGTPAFPISAAVNPSDFAARVRAALGDDKRLVRLFGSTTVIARLTGDGKRARLILLNFARNRTTTNAANLRARVLGRYKPSAFAAYGAAAGAALEDVTNPTGGTEFTLPAFNTVAIIDLEPLGR